MRFLNGHLGSTVSALVDGQLDTESAERAWAHVATCPPCRRLVEREGWVKRQLAQIAGGSGATVQEPPDQLVGSLLDLDPSTVGWSEWNHWGEAERSARTRRRAGLVLIGAGSVSAAVLGLTALSGSPVGSGSRSPAANIGGASSSTPTPAVVAPAAAVHGRLRGWELDGSGTLARPTGVGTRP
jgi:anti-sigma factor RsiW